MEKLNAWSDGNIIFPLLNLEQSEENWETVCERVKKAIREKVLESYRNGCRAAGGAVRRELNQSSDAGRPAGPVPVIARR